MKRKPLIILLMAALFSFSLPQEKEVSIKLTPGEVAIVYNAIDNAPLAGEVRKPLLQKISVQYQAQMDTTKKK